MKSQFDPVLQHLSLKSWRENDISLPAKGLSWKSDAMHVKLDGGISFFAIQALV